MLKRLKVVVCAVALLCGVGLSTLQAQHYVKLNGLYALAGVINPAVEFGLSKHSTFQTELVISPWRSITTNGVQRPMLFGIFMNEYRYYFKQSNSGWYVAGNAGLMIFNMTKPQFSGGFGFKDTSAKGYGMMFGAAGGYEKKFKDKWILDAFFGWGYMLSHYNSYALVDGIVESGRVYNRGEIIMTPHRTVQPTPEDPFNGSAEWLPNKIGVSIGVLIFDPAKRRR